MKRIHQKTLTMIGLVISMLMLSSLACASSLQGTLKHPRLTPYKDPIYIKFVGMHSNVSIGYHNDNGVNISGPSTVNSGTYTIYVSSDNQFESGDPSMTIDEGTQKCTIPFDDGPWTWLSFTSNKDDNTPPSCGFYQVSRLANSNSGGIPTAPYSLTVTSLH